MNCNVKNANYGRVMTVLEKLSTDAASAMLCRCTCCLNDVAAIALNLLPPHYHAGESEEPDLGSPWIMVETAVKEAIELVKQTPHHGRPAAGGRAKSGS